MEGQRSGNLLRVTPFAFNRGRKLKVVGLPPELGRKVGGSVVLMPRERWCPISAPQLRCLDNLVLTKSGARRC